MRGDGVVERANNGGLIRDLRHLGEMLANLDSAHVACDRLKLAADAFGRARLEVPHVDRGRPAGKPDHDNCIGTPLDLALILGSRRPSFEAQELGQAKAEETGRTDLEKVAAMESLAVGPAWS